MSLQEPQIAQISRHTAMTRDLLWGYVILCLAILSWILLMWPMFRAGPLVLDEHGSYWIIDSGLPGTSLERSLNYAAIPPLSGWFQSVFLNLFGKSEFIFRLPSALCALGAIIISYMTGKELRNHSTGGVMALLVAWHPEALDEIRIARCYGLVLFLGALVFWITARWLKNPQSTGWALTWAISSSALLWTHYTSALLIITSGLGLAGTFLISHQFHKKSFGLLLLAAGILITLSWRLIPSILRLNEWGPALNYSGGSASLGEIFGHFWWAGFPLAFLVVLIFGGHLNEQKTSKPLAFLTALCVLIPLSILWLMSRGDTSSLANPRYRVAYAPVAAGLVSMILTYRSRNMISVIAAISLLAVSWYFSANSPLELGRLNHPTAFEWKELNEYFAANSSAGEKVFVQSGLTESHLVPLFYEDPLFMEYVACRVSRFYVEESHPRYALPYLWEGAIDMIAFYEDLMLESKESHQSFWVACATDTDLNRNSLAGIQKIASRQGFILVEERDWKNATLMEFTFQNDH